MAQQQKTQSALELVTELDENREVKETAVYVTPRFIPFDVTYEAIELMEEIQNAKSDFDKEVIDKMMNFIVHRLYEDRFTIQEFKKGVHGPDFFRILQEQISFVAEGYQSDATKKLVAKHSKASAAKS